MNTIKKTRTVDAKRATPDQKAPPAARSAKCSTPPAWGGGPRHKRHASGEVSQVSNTDGLERWCLEKKIDNSAVTLTARSAKCAEPELSQMSIKERGFLINCRC